jgi:hypothetical protein
MATNIGPWLPIHDAAAKGDADALRQELERGWTPDQVGPHGLAPLHFAASCGASRGEDNQLACVSLLIDAGANVSAASSHCNNMTALMYAAVGERPTLVAALLNAGADVNHRDGTGWTALHYAMFNDSADCTHLLIKAGAAMDARCGDGMTPLDLCISGCHRDDAAGSNRQLRLYSVLLRSGAALPAETDDAYIRKVIAAGSFQNYERAHLNAIVASFAPKFSHLLPPELVRRVVEYAFHVGDY